MTSFSRHPKMPELFFVGALSLDEVLTERLTFTYPRFLHVLRYALLTILWYLLFVLFDARIFPDLSSSLGLTLPVIVNDAGYIAGLFWVVGGIQKWRTRVFLILCEDLGRVRFEYERGNVLLYQEWDFSEVIDVINCSGRRGIILNSGMDLPSLRIGALGGHFRNRHEFSLWLAEWIGCGWCGLDRRGRVTGHLPAGK